MNFIPKKRFVAAALAAATLGGGAYAFAANLSVSSQNLGAGSGPVQNTCNQIDVQYKTAYAPNTPLATPPVLPTYNLSEIDLNLTAAGGVHGCTAEFYKVTVAKSDGTILKQYVGQLGQSPQATGTDKIDASSDKIDANGVGSVTAVVTNQQQS